MSVSPFAVLVLLGSRPPICHQLWLGLERVSRPQTHKSVTCRLSFSFDSPLLRKFQHFLTLARIEISYALAIRRVTSILFSAAHPMEPVRKGGDCDSDDSS